MNSCTPWDLDQVDFPEVITGKDSIIGPQEVIIKGEVKGLLAGNFVDQHGHLWSKFPIVGTSLETILTNSDEVFINSETRIGNGEFETRLSDLDPGATYFYRAFVIKGDQSFLAEEEASFVMDSLSISMSLRVDTIFSRDRTASVITTFSNLPKGLTISAYGLCWAQHKDPQIDKDPFLPKEAVIIDSDSGVLMDTSLIYPGGGLNYVRPFLVVGDRTWYGADSNFVVGDFWVEKAPFAGGKTHNAVSFTIDSLAYVIQNTGGDNFWIFNPNAGPVDPRTGVRLGEWKGGAPFPGVTRDRAVAFALQLTNGEWRGYYGTGGIGTAGSRDDFWEYLPKEKIWRRKTPYRGGRRQSAVAFALNNKGFVGLGEERRIENGQLVVEWYPDFYEWDPLGGDMGTDEQGNKYPLGEWIRKEDFLAGFGAQISVAEASVGGQGYIFGGIYKQAFRYDPTDDSTGKDSRNNPKGKWHYLGRPPGQVYRYPAAFVIGSKVYVGTGRVDALGTIHSEFWAYNFSEPNWNKAWTRLADVGGNPREWATGFAIGNKGYIGMGQGDGAVDDVWEYFPQE